MPKHRIGSGLACLSLLLVVLFSAGCFETSDKSPTKLRVFYTSDVVGSLEPCG